MSGSGHGTPTDRASRRVELVDQLARIEVERRNPESALGPEILSTVADSLRTQIKVIDESVDAADEVD